MLAMASLERFPGILDRQAQNSTITRDRNGEMEHPGGKKGVDSVLYHEAHRSFKGLPERMPVHEESN